MRSGKSPDRRNGRSFRRLGCPLLCFEPISLTPLGHIDRVHEKIDVTSVCCHPIDGATASFSSRNRDRANPHSTPTRAGEALLLRAEVKQPAAPNCMLRKCGGVTRRRIYEGIVVNQWPYIFNDFSQTCFLGAVLTNAQASIRGAAAISQ